MSTTTTAEASLNWSLAEQRRLAIGKAAAPRKVPVLIQTASVPDGISASAPTRERHELQIIFDILDPGKLGTLTRGKARAFLRCVGWCVSYTVLDEMLDMSTVAKEIQRKIDHGFFSAAELQNDRDTTRTLGAWQLDDLIDVINANKTRQNNSLEIVENALLRLSSGRGKIFREKAVETLKQFHGISEKHFNEALAAAGVGCREALDVKGLARALLTRVVTTPEEDDPKLDFTSGGASVVQWS
eukprot:TRINITY_DN18582_c0_g1_i1.p1 TRINITY_DN18582_c0_g1~~TRINITY_DN18582_c0_g1_i1.p1  ORF type:complete len:243 (-),score=46.11 TRINITY_DN18582_c0_g1_i1:334-1062(-)